MPVYETFNLYIQQLNLALPHLEYGVATYVCANNLPTMLARLSALY